LLACATECGAHSTAAPLLQQDDEDEKGANEDVKDGEEDLDHGAPG